MSEEGSEISVATFSSRPNWLDFLANPLSLWNNTTPWCPTNLSSNCSYEEEISMPTSFTNASNHSSLSDNSSNQLVEPSSSDEFIGETASDNHLWSHVLLCLGSGGDLQTNQDVGENFLDTLSSKNISTEIFEPACGYLNKMENCWEFLNSPSSNNFEQKVDISRSLIESERPTNLSNIVSKRSMSPQDPKYKCQINPPICNISLNSSINQYPKPDLSHMKQNLTNSSSYGVEEITNTGFFPCYEHDMTVESKHQGFESTGASFNSNDGLRCQIGLNNSVIGEESKYYYEMSDGPCSNIEGFLDLNSFSGSLNKPFLNHQSTQPCLISSSADHTKKQQHPPYRQTRGNRRGRRITSEGKKKRSGDTISNSETLLKKHKLESSTVSSLKTDTASVLFETIAYIKFLQGQVQLLSNPYMKANTKRDPWGGMERIHKPDTKLDLKSRGLCLIPISCTPKAYRENIGSDYWTPSYRGSFYG
ncbi:hypothetical protein HHK36_014675 [Tetracentron sinense]|uniref:Uncharacterized protein n=1 Tax=Tetracentron sinense TaxID=13715 RepID=A0A834Z3B9_TETSI|nr:hypothetical protein HHK36_014675 [Tetracentron sinense]